MAEEDDLEDRLRDSGETIYEYTDAQAIADGILIPYRVQGRDTGHRITSNAYETLKAHYNKQDYDDARYQEFFLAELLPLIPEAHREYHYGTILKTTYDFKVTHTETRNILWYLPNEHGGITIMLPEDY